MKLLKRYNKTLFITALILFLSLYNLENLKPDSFQLFENADKLIHLLMYYALTTVLIFEYNTARNENLVRRLIISMYPLVFGALVEVIQHYLTEGRSGEWLDLLANTVGIMIAIVTFRLVGDNAVLIRVIKFPAK